MIGLEPFVMKHVHFQPRLQRCISHVACVATPNVEDAIPTNYMDCKVMPTHDQGEEEAKVQVIKGSFHRNITHRYGLAVHRQMHPSKNIRSSP